MPQWGYFHQPYLLCAIGEASTRRSSSHLYTNTIYKYLLYIVSDSVTLVKTRENFRRFAQIHAKEIGAVSAQFRYFFRLYEIVQVTVQPLSMDEGECTKGAVCMKRYLQTEAVRRAWRTFWQTALGVLSAELVVVVTDVVQQVPGWETGLITLVASSIAAGLAAVMNRKENANGEEGH